MFLNQNSYGEMDVNPTPRPGGPVSIPCFKCGGIFNIEKVFKELHGNSTFFARTNTGTLTPATPKDVELWNLCSSCYNKFKEWLVTK